MTPKHYLRLVGNTATINFNRKDLYTPDISALLTTADVRSTNVTLPGTAGQRSYAAVADFTAVSVEVHADGRWNANGTAAANRTTRMLAQREELRTELAVAPAGARGTRVGTLVFDDGALWTANVKVLRAVPKRWEGDDGEIVVYDLLMELPDGEFAP